MKYIRVLSIIVLLGCSNAWAAGDEVSGPRTGYFKVATTPSNLLGETGAQAVSSLFDPDQRLVWQLYVPENYDAARPAGLMVFVSRHAGGGGRKAWNSVLQDNNVIWIGALRAGDPMPVNERMVRALLARAVAEKDYAIDATRIYVSGYAGGAHIATMLASSKPETFRGGLFFGGALPWGDKKPPKIAAMKRNRYVFITGSNDIAKNKVARTVRQFRDAGIHTELIVVPNMRQSMPGPSYFDIAIRFLDARTKDGSE